jgi:hypothetical protein
MADAITKLMEEQRKELVAAGEIGLDEKARRSPASARIGMQSWCTFNKAAAR